MKAETGALAVKSAATGGVAFAVAFGLTWIAVAAAVVGAFVSLHFEKEALPSTVWKLLAKILSLAFLALMVAAALHHVPGFGWTEEIQVEVRAGIVGVIANPTYALIRLVMTWFGTRFGNTSGG